HDVPSPGDEVEELLVHGSRGGVCRSVRALAAFVQLSLGLSDGVVGARMPRAAVDIAHPNHLFPKEANPAFISYAATPRSAFAGRAHLPFGAAVPALAAAGKDRSRNAGGRRVPLPVAD